MLKNKKQNKARVITMEVKDSNLEALTSFLEEFGNEVFKKMNVMVYMTKSEIQKREAKGLVPAGRLLSYSLVDNVYYMEVLIYANFADMVNSDRMITTSAFTHNDEVVINKFIIE